MTTFSIIENVVPGTLPITPTSGSSKLLSKFNQHLIDILSDH